MSGRLAGKTAFVTAAGQGIGAHTALAFAADGARVIATDIDEAKVRQIASDTHSHREAGRAARRRHRAGRDRRGPDRHPVQLRRLRASGHACSKPPKREWELAFDLNVRSMFRTMRAFLPGMLRAAMA